MIRSMLDRIPYLPLILLAVCMLLAPFRPMPHLVEKMIMLQNGALTRPIDLFDVIFHLAPTLILLWKWILGRRS